MVFGPAASTRFIGQSQEIIDVAKELNSDQIAKLMKVSEKIAFLNEERFSEWTQAFDKSNSRPAVYAFKADALGHAQ